LSATFLYVPIPSMFKAQMEFMPITTSLICLQLSS